MALTSGSYLGPYEIVALLGEGGMGGVYRALDTKLGRQVAVKILLDSVAADRERIARFEREARMLAALNHPHIAALYGMEESDGRHFLVMELVEGQTLAERLARGAIRVEESLAIARQIAEALEAAHERGIIHRDLKPANVKVSPDGRVKVLDFGLAKAMSDETAVGAAPGATHSPTLSMMATQAGLILGTAAYMSPEQAKGMPADHRSDVFSFGCVLYEMLTGRQPFHGETTPDVLASVLVREPDLTALPPNLSPRLVELLKRCLEKHPRRRWQATGDLRNELEAVAAAPLATAAAHGSALPQPLWKRVIPIAAAAMVASAVTAVVVWGLRPAPQAPLVVRFSIPLGDDFSLSSLSRNFLGISPDGKQMAYASANGLYLRSLSEFERTRVANLASTVVGMPVFSPDSKSVGFYSVVGSSISKVSVQGGSPIPVVPSTPAPFGMSWSASGLLYVETNVGIMRAPSSGGKPERLVQQQADETLYGPQLLPDGQHVLFTRVGASPAGLIETSEIVVESLSSHQRSTVIEAGSEARLLPTGHLVYALAGVLFAAPFDSRSLKTTGAPVAVLEGVRRSVASTPAALYDVSDNGTLIYVPGPASFSATGLDVAMIDRDGAVAPLKLPPGPYEFPRVAPDGKRIAVQRDDGKQSNVWIYDLSGSASLRRLTNAGRNSHPVWSPDNQRVAYQSDREGDAGLFWQQADGTGTAERLTTSEKDVEHIPESWSPDGQHLLFARTTKAGTSTLWTLSLKDRTVTRFGDFEIRARNLPSAAFSPDGQLVAYGVGTEGIFVQPFPPTGATVLVDVGIHPVWSVDGKELFYRQRGQTFAVSVTTKPTFAFGKPVPVKMGSYRQRGPTVARELDPAPDGTHFAAVVLAGGAFDASEAQIRVVVNWFEELKQRVPIPK